jgi:WD40 repeat protein
MECPDGYGRVYSYNVGTHRQCGSDEMERRRITVLYSCSRDRTVKVWNTDGHPRTDVCWTRSPGQHTGSFVRRRIAHCWTIGLQMRRKRCFELFLSPNDPPTTTDYVLLLGEQPTPLKRTREKRRRLCSVSIVPRPVQCDHGAVQCSAVQAGSDLSMFLMT